MKYEKNPKKRSDALEYPWLSSLAALADTLSIRSHADRVCRSESRSGPWIAGGSSRVPRQPVHPARVGESVSGLASRQASRRTEEDQLVEVRIPPVSPSRGWFFAQHYGIGSEETAFLEAGRAIHMRLDEAESTGLLHSDDGGS